MKIGISGSYGMHNLGDEAILESIVKMIRERVPSAEFRIFSRNALHTNEHHGFDAVDVRRLTDREIAGRLSDLDVFILGGGGILYDGEVHLYLREANMATLLGVPLVVYAVGAGPLKNPDDRSLVGKVLSKAAVVTTRDSESMELLRACGVRASVMEVTADPALLLEPCDQEKSAAFLAAEGLKPGERLIGVSVRQPDVTCPWLERIGYHELLAEAVDFLLGDEKARALFVPMEPAHDIEQAKIVVGKMRHAGRAITLEQNLRPCEAMGLIGHLELAVGMRLHFTIMAAAVGVPIAPLYYAPKVNAFVRELGIGLPEQNLAGLASKDFVSLIERVELRGGDLRRAEKAAIESMKSRARRSNELLFERVLGERIAQGLP